MYKAVYLFDSRIEYSVKSRGQSSNQRNPWSSRGPKEKSHRQTSSIKRPDLKRILQCKQQTNGKKKSNKTN